MASRVSGEGCGVDIISDWVGRAWCQNRQKILIFKSGRSGDGVNFVCMQVYPGCLSNSA
ncbi:hypothetical protein [Nitrosomonas cryotolerans]|uniref:hypothetical protein n=1 Tax=Nitrosomonas cryotolerans TaxID=44575 RepID=UPI0015BCCC60|nr:hypothetical protein [Nitrosomonas cryotolerans]